MSNKNAVVAVNLLCFVITWIVLRLYELNNKMNRNQGNITTVTFCKVTPLTMNEKFNKYNKRKEEVLISNLEIN